MPGTHRASVASFERQTSHQTGMDDHRADHGRGGLWNNSLHPAVHQVTSCSHSMLRLQIKFYRDCLILKSLSLLLLLLLTLFLCVKLKLEYIEKFQRHFVSERRKLCGTLVCPSTIDLPIGLQSIGFRRIVIIISIGTYLVKMI